MGEEVRKRVMELLKKDGNNVCADCKLPGPEWASTNLGVFLCTQCAGIHRSLGSYISRVKSITLDNWQEDHVTGLEEWGNLKANAKYEAQVPLCYRRPDPSTVQVLKEQWVRAKYERQEFVNVDKQIYTSGRMEGLLFKRGREDSRFQPRKFVLNETDDTLKYYVKENHRDPKTTMKISQLNATFCPSKIGNPNGLQITSIKDGSTRSIFVYSEDGKDIVDWYMAIRSAKLHRLEVAFPGANQAELACRLTRDFLKEGWLFKTGPRGAEAYKKRWFTLDDRKLMYYESPLDAYPKGEVFLGFRGDGYGVRQGVPPGMKEHNFGFTLKTPDRSFLMGAESEKERREWMDFLQSVLVRPTTPQENNMAAQMVRKRATLSSPLHILKVR